jgi:hypothetical protein
MSERANREKALFSHIFNKAGEWGYTALQSACQGVRGFKEAGRSRYVTDAEFAMVKAHAQSGRKQRRTPVTWRTRKSCSPTRIGKRRSTTSGRAQASVSSRYANPSSVPSSSKYGSRS